MADASRAVLRATRRRVAPAYDRAPEAIEDWIIAVWLSAHEDSFHDTTVAKPLASVALVAR